MRHDEAVSYAEDAIQLNHGEDVELYKGSVLYGVVRGNVLRGMDENYNSFGRDLVSFAQETHVMIFDHDLRSVIEKGDTVVGVEDGGILNGGKFRITNLSPWNQQSFACTLNRVS